MLEREYIEQRAFDTVRQLAMAQTIVETASQNPYSDYHKAALLHEMDCENDWQIAAAELKRINNL